MSSTVTTVSSKEDERAVFEKAKEYLRPGCFFRFVTNIYTERKLFLFLWIHCVCTVVIWIHYGLVKYDSETESIQEDTPRYWLKRFVPPFVSPRRMLDSPKVPPCILSHSLVRTLLRYLAPSTQYFFRWP
jgi:hypothetical protein